MSIFNRKGVEFQYVVKVPRAPGSPDPTYSFKFPTLGPNGRVVERWGSKVRPIKSLTPILRGCSLKRYQDYMIEWNGNEYEYWFLDQRWALMFQIASAGYTQSVASKNPLFSLECPMCKFHIHPHNFTWV